MEFQKCKCGKIQPLALPNFCSNCGTEISECVQMISPFTNCTLCGYIISRSENFCCNCGQENLYLKYIREVFK